MCRLNAAEHVEAVITILLLLGGLVLLVVGGELLVRGSVRTAEQFGVSPLLIGLTLVGFGTSTPELVTSVQAAMVGSPGIAVGNIVGSNIANILLILGFSALIYPMAIQSASLRRDGTLVLVTGFMLAAVGWTIGLNMIVGAAFVAMLVAYFMFAYRQERLTDAASPDHTAALNRAEAVELTDPGLRPGTPARDGIAAILAPLAMAILGLLIIICGGKLLVGAAVALARQLGVSEEVIGLTVVAVGTSMPELVTSIVAAFKRQSDVAFGNIVGSNIYNSLGIGGVTALIAPTQVPEQIAKFDIPLMLVASTLLLIFAATGRQLSRLEGGIFLAIYIGYVAFLMQGVTV